MVAQHSSDIILDVIIRISKYVEAKVMVKESIEVELVLLCVVWIVSANCGREKMLI